MDEDQKLHHNPYMMNLVVNDPSLRAAIDLDGKFKPADPKTKYFETCVVVNEDPPRLDFQRAPNAPAPTKELNDLRRQIEDVVRLVRVLFENDPSRRRHFLDELAKGAAVGLCGDNWNTELGLDNLQSTKNEIADVYPSLRAVIWQWNAWAVAVAALACGLASVDLHARLGVWVPDFGPGHDPLANWALAVFLIPLGATLGLFAEFLFRVNDDIPYERLQAINPGRWKPAQRAVNTIVVAFILAAILGMGALKLGAGDVLLNDFVGANPYLSGVIGFLTGLAFPYVRDLLQQFQPLKK